MFSRRDDNEDDDILDQISVSIPGFEVKMPGVDTRSPMEMLNRPDTVLIVDGDPAVAEGWPDHSLAVGRRAMVTFLSELHLETGVEPDVVFDGNVSEAGADLPVSEHVRVRLATAPGRPGDAIAEMIRAYPRFWSLVVATDNEAIAEDARSRSLQVMSIDDLLDLFGDDE